MAGHYTEFGDDFVLTEYGELITDAVVADDRIAIDWEAYGEKLGVALRAGIDSGMEIWRGDITGAEPGIKRGEISAVRYDLESGGVLLIVKWWQDGYQGNGMYELYAA